MPLLARIEQCVGNFLIVDRLKKAKHAALFFVMLVVRVVENRRNSPDDFAIPNCKKRLDLRIVVERMWLIV